jgi:diguanylate cyclase (GGDEF)-like protein
MESKTITGLDKIELVMHRVVYFVFVAQEFLTYFFNDEANKKWLLGQMAILVLCIVVEEVSYHSRKFSRPDILKWVRFIQCLLVMILFLLSKKGGYPELMGLTLLVMFVIDFFRVAEIEKASHVWYFVLAIGAPVMLIIGSKMSNEDGRFWRYMFFDLVVIFVILIVEAMHFIDYVMKKDKVIFEQRNKYTDMVEQNADMLELQMKMKDTNMLLNTQKVELQRANHQIQKANQEMNVQAEILRYIATSFEMSEISNQIVETIMETRKLSFCAAYIKENVYLNKEANYVIKSNIKGLEEKFRDHMESILSYMVEHDEREGAFYDDLREKFYFIEDENINSLYVKVLEQEDQCYGLFMVGSDKKQAFVDNMSFYDVIGAQYNIAVNNVKIYNEEQHLARTDGLTGINNRIYFNYLFRTEVEKVLARQENISAALFDIDKFKSVNDTYGHLAGDEVIKRIATLTANHIERHDGFVCRYGGEEFVAVLPGRNIEQTRPIIEELFETICNQIVEYNEFRIPISVSIGLTAYPEVCTDTDDLLKRADWCMYYAKEHGRHQICVDDGSIQNV